MQCRGVSREWRGALNHALPLLCLVSFPVCVTGEGVQLTLGLVAGGSLQVVGMVMCLEMSSCDIEEILKLLHATCQDVREVDITWCIDQVILRALSMSSLSTFCASPLDVHAHLMVLVRGSVRCPFDTFLMALVSPRLVFDQVFAPAEGTFLSETLMCLKEGVLEETCIAGSATAGWVSCWT